MGGVVKAIGKGVGAVTGGLIGGGGSSSSQSIDLAPESNAEKKRRLAIEKEIAKLLKGAKTPNKQDMQIQNLFRSSVIDFLSKDATGQVNPETLKGATEFVDQTFTNSAQLGVDKANRQFEAKQAEIAARTGRQVGDSSLQSQLFQQMLDTQSQLGAERGSQIAQRADLMQLRPMQVGLTGLQGSNFINDLNTRALSNQVGLLNLQSGVLNNFRDERFKRAGVSTQTSGSNQGLLGNVAALGAGIGNLPGDVGRIVGGLKGLF